MSSFETIDAFLRELARIMLSGPWSVDAVHKRTLKAIRSKPKPRWVRPLAVRVCDWFEPFPPPRHRGLLGYLKSDRRLHDALDTFQDKHESLPELVAPSPQMMHSTGPFPECGLPAITTTRQLSDWLGITHPELAWFADCRGWERSRATERQRHYCYQWIRKPRGGLRLIEMPKTRLRLIQRRLYEEILARLPLHWAAHGFRPGRSIVTALSPHVGRRVVLHMDINEFFPSIAPRRINALFRTAGYPEDVARLLTGLCTNRTPDAVLDRELTRFETSHRIVRGRYGDPHVPQGAPTSPALANLMARKLDARLHGLASACDATYTRYADDLIFSGDADFCRCLRRFRIQVCSILMEEGFQIQSRKTRVMYSGQRQQVAGLVLNERLNTTRAAFDELKAILHNCSRFGPETQNLAGHADFRSHLAGRVAWHATVNPQRGRRLKSLFDGIEWPDE